MLAAVDRQSRPGDEAAILVDQEGDAARNLVRAAEAAEWESVTTGTHGRFRNLVVPWELEVRKVKSTIGWDHVRGEDTRAAVKKWLKFASRRKVIADHLKTVKAIKRRTSVDRLMLTHLKRIDAQLSKIDAAWAAFEKQEPKLGPKDLLAAFTKFKDKWLQALIDVLHDAYVAFPTEDDAFAAEKAVIKEFGALAAPPTAAPQPKPKAKAQPQPQP